MMQIEGSSEHVSAVCRIFCMVAQGIERRSLGLCANCNHLTKLDPNDIPTALKRAQTPACKP